MDTPRTSGDIESGLDNVGPLGVCDGLELGFKDIQYRVATRQGNKAQILKGISGSCTPGRFLAIMGASGAGKTSLIDILSGHLEKGVCGELTVNGLPFKASEFRKRSCYVLQRDVFLASATVKEAITTSALLRLPPQMSRAEKRQRVEDVMQQLELEKCGNTMIGDDVYGIKGISGGERRRLSVAIGLVTDPQVILLDEPTSGLDSETAAQLISCLVRLALANRTVVASIHQPSSLITDCFDDLLLLSNGSTVYCGPWAQSVPYFASVGHSCPMYTNPSDFFLTITREAGEVLVKQWAAANKLGVLPDSLQSAKGVEQRAWERDFEHKNSPRRSLGFGVAEEPGTPKIAAFKGLQLELPVSMPSPRTSGTNARSSIGSPASQKNCPPSPGVESVLSVADSWKDFTPDPSPATSWLFQVQVLVVRNVRMWYRTRDLLFGFLAQYIFSGIFIGLMYVQLGTTSSSSIFDRQASLFVALIMLAFTPSASACTVWEAERQLLRREANSGAYKLSTFFAAKTLVLFPIQVFVTLIFSVLLYNIVGYQSHADKFFIFLVACTLFQMISETIGTMAAIVTRNATNAFLLSSTLLYILVAFSGFLISHTPVFFRWIPKISFVAFAYSLLYQNEFHGLQLHLTNANGSPSQNAGLVVNLASSEYECLPTAGQVASKGPGGNDMSIGENMGTLIGIAIGLRIVAFALLKMQFKLKNL